MPRILCAMVESGEKPTMLVCSMELLAGLVRLAESRVVYTGNTLSDFEKAQSSLCDGVQLEWGGCDTEGCSCWALL